MTNTGGSVSRLYWEQVINVNVLLLLYITIIIIIILVIIIVIVKIIVIILTVLLLQLLFWWRWWWWRWWWWWLLFLLLSFIIIVFIITIIGRSLLSYLTGFLQLFNNSYTWTFRSWSRAPSTKAGCASLLWFQFFLHLLIISCWLVYPPVLSGAAPNVQVFAG